jgi:hypothetical protein
MHSIDISDTAILAKGVFVGLQLQKIYKIFEAAHTRFQKFLELEL